MARFVHRSSGTRVEGTRISRGEVLHKENVYESADGTWRPCTDDLVGTTLRDDEIVWVRVENHNHSLVVQGQSPHTDRYADGCPVHAPSKLQ